MNPAIAESVNGSHVSSILAAIRATERVIDQEYALTDWAPERLEELREVARRLDALFAVLNEDAYERKMAEYKPAGHSHGIAF